MCIDKTTIDTAAPLLRSMGHPLRLRILDFLARSATPQRVTEIVESTGAEQAIVSQQLKVLRESGVLSSQRRGNCVFYRITSGNAHLVLNFLRNRPFDALSGGTGREGHRPENPAERDVGLLAA